MNMLYEPPEKPPMRKGRIFTILLIILLDSLLVLALILFFPLLTGSANRRLTSSDWSGYVVATDVNNPQPLVTRIKASWTVPSGEHFNKSSSVRRGLVSVVNSMVR